MSKKQTNRPLTVNKLKQLERAVRIKAGVTEFLREETHKDKPLTPEGRQAANLAMILAGQAIYRAFVDIKRAGDEAALQAARKLLGEPPAPLTEEVAAFVAEQQSIDYENGYLKYTK